MSLKRKDGEIIYFSFVGFIATILTLTFCILTIIDRDRFGVAFNSVICMVIGYFFRAPDKPDPKSE